MNFIEKNGSKIAVGLCTASLIPVVATVYAMEADPETGWHGTKYVNSDQTPVSGWQEIEGKQYYFDESTNELDEEKTVQGVAAVITPDTVEEAQNQIRDVVTQTVQEAVAQSAQDLLTQEPKPVEDQMAEETVTPAEPETPAAEEEPVYEEEQPAGTVWNEPAYEEPVYEEPVYDEPVYQEPVYEEPVYEEPVYEEPVYEEPVYEEPVYEEPVVEEPVYDEPVYEEPVVDEPVYDEPVYEEPVVDEPVYDEPVVDEPVYEEPVNDYSELNQAIVDAAMGLTGVTDGEQCTTVATMALQGAGVQASVWWPCEYTQYGYITDTPQAGNLIWYDRGGGTDPDFEAGIYDHIAIYIGDGMAVHGNYDGKTVIASAEDSMGGTAYYIQVTE